MFKFVDIYLFRGLTRKEKRQFLLSLLLAIVSCAVLFYLAIKY